MRRRSILILLGIVFFGLLIRLPKISSLPLYGDELTMVYDTYSISKTGMDATGEKLPLTFKMGAGRPAGYIYFSVPFVALFGPNAWGIRSLSLLSGVGIIILMYFLGKKLFGEEVGLIGSLLAAISPWDIYLSRAGFEAHFALFLALLGITLFIYKKYIPWAVAWGVAIFTYPTFKLTLPMIFLLLVGIYGIKDLIKSKKFIIGTIILLAFGVSVATQTFFAGSEDRFLSQNIFADKNTKEMVIQKVNNERTVSTLPVVLQPFFINKEIEYGRKVFENYIANLSPNFLILRGDGNPRHNPGEMGMIYLIELPLILISLFLMWKIEKTKALLLFLWILITPLATMFFPEAHALRNNLMLPPLLLLSAYLISRLPKKYLSIVVLAIFLQLVYILVRIYFIAPGKFVTFWSGEAKEAALLAIQSDKNNIKTTLNVTKIDNIEYAYEVYAKLDPREVISQYGKFPKVYGNVMITDK